MNDDVRDSIVQTWFDSYDEQGLKIQFLRLMKSLEEYIKENRSLKNERDQLLATIEQLKTEEEFCEEVDLEDYLSFAAHYLCEDGVERYTQCDVEDYDDFVNFIYRCGKYECIGTVDQPHPVKIIDMSFRGENGDYISPEEDEFTKQIKDVLKNDNINQIILGNEEEESKQYNIIASLTSENLVVYNVCFVGNEDINHTLYSYGAACEFRKKSCEVGFYHTVILNVSNLT